MRSYFAALASLLLAGCAPAVSAPPAVPTLPADLVLRGGKVFLADQAGTVVEALAIRGDEVVAAGTSTEVSRHLGPDTEVVELRGRLVTPGFNDAHIHFAPGGVSLLNLDLLGTTSLAEIERLVVERVRTAAPGEWIQGRGWDHTRLPARELGPGGWPTAGALDRAAPNNPVVLSRVDGHVVWANSRAMEAAGIGPATEPPAGGEIVRDPATGEATGVFLESAQALIERYLPDPSPATLRRGIEAAMELAASSGVTSVQTSASAEELRVYRELQGAGELTVRVYAWRPLGHEVIEGFRQLGIGAGFGDAWLRTGLVKGYADGTLGSRTAYMLEPFADDADNRGLPQYSQAELDSLVLAADAAGLQVIVHAIGDAANRMVLDAFERAARVNGSRERRHRVEHAQVLDARDIPRFAGLGVIASMQPTHATSDMRWAEDRLGPERAREGAYAWRSLLEAGAALAFGTDFPVEPMRPVEGIYSAVTRQSREDPGTPPGGWLPGQRLSRAEAIRLYTAGSAYSEWEETRKGTLEPGMLADLVLWSDDLLTAPAAQILKAEPVLTVVGGRVVYRQ